MRGTSFLRVAVAAALAACLGAAPTTEGAPPSPDPTAAAPGRTALGWAFRFASAIRNDPNDRGVAQELVVREYLGAGLLDEAAATAAQVDGWRRGVAHAEVAVALALAGRDESAREQLARAEAVRQTVEGWQNPRISAHIARAVALLGDVDEASRISDRLEANDIQYAGVAETNAALGMASRGDFDAALSRLQVTDEARARETAWWRADAYLALARRDDLESAQRAEALEAAIALREMLSVWKLADVLRESALLYRGLGRAERAASLLAEAERLIVGLPKDRPGRAPGLARLAEALAAGGEKERAAGLLREAESSVPLGLVTERPAGFAEIAAAWMAVDPAEGHRVWELAIASAESLRNPRPRNLAAAAICRRMGSAGIDPDPSTLRRFEALLAVAERVLPAPAERPS